MCCGFPVLAYHKIDNRKELGITSISPRRFGRQVKFLKHEGYASISPQFLSSDKSIAPSRPVLITFDDGYDGIYRYAYPILKEFSATAIVFVTTGYVGRYNEWDSSPGPRFRHLDWTQIREMADDGMWFGSHSVNHRFLTKLCDRAVRNEVEASKKVLEDKLGRAVHCFSYPYGNYDNRIMRLVQEAGYEAAFSLRPELMKIGCSDGSGSVYKLPRIAIYLLDNMRAFSAKIDHIRRGSLPYAQKLKNRLINRCAYASMLIRRPGFDR